MGDGTAEEQRAKTRRPRWRWVAVLLLLAAPTCAQLGIDSVRIMEWHVPPAIPPQLSAPLALMALGSLAMASWEARRASLGVLANFFVACILSFFVLAPAQPLILRLRCSAGGADACAWLGERARADGDRTKALAYLEAACQGAPQRDAFLYAPALACVALATLQPERAPALLARVSALDTYRADQASATLTACFVDPVPACAEPCAQLSDERLWLGPFRVHACLRDPPSPQDRPTAPAPP
jgi:hypothetical protein